MSYIDRQVNQGFSYTGDVKVCNYLHAYPHGEMKCLCITTLSNSSPKRSITCHEHNGG